MKTSITPTNKSNLFRIPKRMLIVLPPDKLSRICRTLSSMKMICATDCMTIPACIISQGKMLFITEYSDWSGLEWRFDKMLRAPDQEP